jgi:2'-5' RNA ligase
MGPDANVLGSLWHPIRDRGKRKLIVLAHPNSHVHNAIAALGCAERLGQDAFSPDNWHQSLSVAYVDTPKLRRLLRVAAGRLSARSITLCLSMLRSNRNERGSYNWEVRSAKRSVELDALLAAINAAVAAVGLPDGVRHWPHVTLSYTASSPISAPRLIAPIEWTIDTIELVSGGGTPYGYDTLESWALLPDVVLAPAQAGLF